MPQPPDPQHPFAELPESTPTGTSNFTPEALAHKISSVRSGIFSRGVALTKLSVNLGSRALGQKMAKFLRGEDAESPARYDRYLRDQLQVLAGELGQLKGTIMKMGQMLSVYGEHFLPPELNQILKSLQNRSPPLSWEAVREVVERHYTLEQLAALEIDPQPVAAASLGQVHRARVRATGELLALKIQYPGVREATEGDIRVMRRLLSLFKVVPKSETLEPLFAKVKAMMERELDYEMEAQTTRQFGQWLAKDCRFVVPRVFPEYSGANILATSFEEGFAVDSVEVANLEASRRNALGSAALELYLKELYDFGSIQTDVHLGNFKVRFGQGSHPDQLILFDFGAVRTVAPDFLQGYLRLIAAVHARDEATILKQALRWGFLYPEDSPELRQAFVSVGSLINEPFFDPQDPLVERQYFNDDGSYRWGDTDLLKRVALMGTDLLRHFRLRPPPSELAFLDRKMVGLLTLLTTLRAEFNARQVIAPYLEKFLATRSGD